MTQQVLNIATTTINGSRVFGPFAIGNNTVALISVDRTVSGGLNSLDATTQLVVTIQSSPDGTTWFDEVSATWPGGVSVNPKNGLQYNTSGLEVRGIDPSRTACRVVTVVTGTASSVTIAGSVTVT